ncbi:hypothetical protein FRC07_012979 [Ceratobasidium sp. 392]|nr:hypothetical protein FRC07_012979 [Ceratobasidium sp. 392]
MDYGRNRDSIADIEERLSEIFETISSTATNEEGVPVIPASELPTILAEYSKRHGARLLSADGEVQLRSMLDANPDAQLTPALTISLVAGLTKSASDDNPAPLSSKDDPSDPRSDSSGVSSPDTNLRGRGEGTPHRPPPLSRTSSNSSFHATNAPATPLSSGRMTSSSPFDSTARRRSTPLSTGAPSAWTRKPLPASRRRKSDAGSNNGNKSGSENENSPAVVRNPRRARAPSNPVSPRQEMFPPSAFPTSASDPISSSDHNFLSSARRTQSFDQSIGMSQTLVDPDLSYAKSIKTAALKFHSSGSDSDTDPEEHSDDEDMTRRYWAREREALENSIETLEVELGVTRQAVNELDEQKQENLLLKETIDRMRFDLDALRAGMGPAAVPEGQGTLSRSLANEIREGFERREREREEARDAEEVDGVVVEQQDGEGSEDGYIETTVTTRKRVGNRSKPVVRLDDGNMREYVDASAQHDESEFLTSLGVQHQQSEFVSESGVQHQLSEFTAAAGTQTEVKVLHDMEAATEPLRLKDVEIETESPQMQNVEIETEGRELKDFNSGTETPEVREVQTEAWTGIECGVGPDGVGAVDMGVETEVPEVACAEIGTEAGVEVKAEMCEAEVQTDPEPILAPHVHTTVATIEPGPADLPPPYPLAAESGVLKRWHARRGHRTPGSVHAREEWAALKRLVGVECQVIERVIEGQDIDNLVEDKDDENTEPAPSRARKLFRVSFEFTSWPYLLTHAVMGFGVWSLAAAVVVNQLVPQTPTYADRMNWSAYNNYAGALGEGLVGRTGDSALWTMVERLVLGAAVRVGPGMPT